MYEKKIDDDKYKYSLMQGFQNSSLQVDVSVKFLFSLEIMLGAGINWIFGPQLIAAYHLKKMQEAVDFSGIKIKFRLHCIAYSDGTDKRTGRKFADMNTAEYLKFFNNKTDTTYFGQLRSDADLLILIRSDTGDQSSISIFNGVRYSETSVLIGEDFIFDKYTLLHEIGHVFGCAHEEDTVNWWGNKLKPLVPTSYAKIMSNGYCGIMANPQDRICKPALFYSNPEVWYQGERTGSFRANNALWINNNRIALANVGKESIHCLTLHPISDVFNFDMIQDMVSTKENFSNFDAYTNATKWGKR